MDPSAQQPASQPPLGPTARLDPRLWRRYDHHLSPPTLICGAGRPGPFLFDPALQVAALHVGPTRAYPRIRRGGTSVENDGRLGTCRTELSSFYMLAAGCSGLVEAYQGPLVPPAFSLASAIESALRSLTEDGCHMNSRRKGWDGRLMACAAASRWCCHAASWA